MDAYFLQTERLGFRRWQAGDRELALALWGDPEVTRLIGGPFSPEQIDERLALEARLPLQYWPVFDLESGEHVGCCGLRARSEDVFELGFQLRREQWGCGYASEAARAVIAYAFDVLGAASLFAGHHPANDASRRLLEKLGFEHTHDELYEPTGLMHPSYALTSRRVV